MGSHASDIGKFLIPLVKSGKSLARYIMNGHVMKELVINLR